MLRKAGRRWEAATSPAFGKFAPIVVIPVPPGRDRNRTFSVVRNSSRPCENSTGGISGAASGLIEVGMTYIAGHDRSQALLLPEAVDDYVGPENPVRFIDAFVDELDLAEAGFAGVAAKPTGRPGYAPKDLLKLYIFIVRLQNSPVAGRAGRVLQGNASRRPVFHPCRLTPGFPSRRRDLPTRPRHYPGGI